MLEVGASKHPETRRRHFLGPAQGPWLSAVLLFILRSRAVLKLAIWHFMEYSETGQ